MTSRLDDFKVADICIFSEFRVISQIWDATTTRMKIDLLEFLAFASIYHYLLTYWSCCSLYVCSV